jgi:S-(hydroxymethyl)glutathione dehydrogenase/alcohol dehydrogenase
MKALVVNALGREFELEDIDIAAPMGREVLIDVQASGLCHTDLLFATNDIVPMPAVLGHEVSGIVAGVGADVTRFRVGDHVVGSLAQSCGWCARCQTGHSFQCQHPEATLRRPTDAPRLSRHGVGLFQSMGRGKPPWKPSGRRLAMPAMRPAKLKSEKADRVTNRHRGGRSLR